MRESIGGTLLFWIVLFLLSMFIIFMAFVIKYARVYKIKNSMINYIERNEGVISQENFDAYLLHAGYAKDGQYKLCRYMQDKGGYFYLELYSVTAFPVIGNFVSINVTIKGETKNIVTGTRIRNVDTGSASDNGWFYSSTDECKICSINTRSCENVEAH